MQRQLVERARNDDHDAFAGLAGAAIGRLYAAARLILRDPDRAEDAVQETLVRCWRDIPTVRDIDRFDARLHRLFLNAESHDVTLVRNLPSRRPTRDRPTGDNSRRRSWRRAEDSQE